MRLAIMSHSLLSVPISACEYHTLFISCVSLAFYSSSFVEISCRFDSKYSLRA